MMAVAEPVEVNVKVIHTKEIVVTMATIFVRVAMEMAKNVPGEGDPAREVHRFRGSSRSQGGSNLQYHAEASHQQGSRDGAEDPCRLESLPRLQFRKADLRYHRDLNSVIKTLPSVHM